jgi:hypothetical protein
MKNIGPGGNPDKCNDIFLKPGPCKNIWLMGWPDSPTIFTALAKVKETKKKIKLKIKHFKLLKSFQCRIIFSIFLIKNEIQPTR